MSLRLGSGGMRLLVLGGTSFVGRAIVDDALRAGAEVTIFSRAGPEPACFPVCPGRFGDRDTGDYAALRDGRWDAVADVSGYIPRHVGRWRSPPPTSWPGTVCAANRHSGHSCAG